MKTVQLGSKKIGLKATPLALLFYKQEFGSDLVTDLIELSKAEMDLSKLDFVVLLQLVWAMNRTYTGPGKQFPNFEEWLAQFDSMNLDDEQFYLDVLEEAEHGFFRGVTSGGPKPPAK